MNGEMVIMCLFKFQVCLTLFKTELELKEHILTDHLHSSRDAYRVERQIFVCDDCCEIFFNKLQLEIHVQHNHLKLRRKGTFVQCPKCGHRIKLVNIWFHFQSHGIQSVSSCRICFTKCNNRKHLREHMKKHPKYLKCELCMYDAKKDVQFKDHINNRHKQTTDVVKLANKDYDKFFVPRAELTWKIQMKTNYKGLQIPNGFRICILCREICKDIESRKNHILVEHNTNVDFVTKKEHKCTCGEIFITNVLLKHHVFKLKGQHKSVK